MTGPAAGPTAVYAIEMPSLVVACRSAGSMAASYASTGVAALHRVVRKTGGHREHRWYCSGVGEHRRGIIRRPELHITKLRPSFVRAVVDAVSRPAVQSRQDHSGLRTVS